MSQHEDHAVRNNVLMVMAVGMSAVSAVFSLPGLAALFAGSPKSAVAMGVALEVAKLYAAHWLKEHWLIAPKSHRFAAITLVAVGMLITVTGVFGNLVEAHLTHVVASQTMGSDALAQITAREADANRRLADAEHQLKVMDDTMAAAGRKGNASRVTAMGAATRGEREAVEAKRKAAGDELARLAGERAVLQSQRTVEHAKSGPLAALTGFVRMIYPEVTDDDVADSFSAVFALALDSWAVFFASVAAKTAKVGAVAASVSVAPTAPQEPEDEGIEERVPEKAKRRRRRRRSTTTIVKEAIAAIEAKKASKPKKPEPPKVLPPQRRSVVRKGNGLRLVEKK